MELINKENKTFEIRHRADYRINDELAYDTFHSVYSHVSKDVRSPTNTFVNIVQRNRRMDQADTNLHERKTTKIKQVIKDEFWKDDEQTNL